MQYRRFGKLDWQASALGFGCMRLPTLEGDRTRIDEPEATRMLHDAIDRGLNYVDTAYPYHGGNSEHFLGRALRGGYRERVMLATKLPMAKVEAPGDFDRFLNEQLQKLQTDHIDFYLFHGLRASRWETVEKLDLLVKAERAIADGRVRYMGFSFHDTFDAFRQIVDAFSWTMCQIQYNYMNEEVQAGTRGLEHAAARGLAVVIMEPLLGGKLVDPPRPVRDVWDAAPVKRNPADWALQWLWNKPEVSVVLSGMNTMRQVEENMASASASGVGTLTAEDLDVVRRVRDRYNALVPVPCTGCAYCMPCPNGVEIPEVFSILNTGAMYDKFGEARRRYAELAEGARADACLACRTCEDQCPQSISVSDWMPVVHQVLGEGKDLVSCQHP